jgi:hypothetical protein
MKNKTGEKISWLQGPPKRILLPSSRIESEFPTFRLVLSSPCFLSYLYAPGRVENTFSRLIPSQLISSAANAFCSSNFTAFRLTPRVGVTAFLLISFSRTLQKM